MSSFHVQKRTMSKVQKFIFQQIFASNDKIFILGGRLGAML